MTMILKINGAKFSNPALNTFFPAPAQGLIGGWLFNDRVRSMGTLDLVLKGNPVFSEKGVLLVSDADAIEADIKDTDYDEMTMIFVGSNTADTTNTNRFIIGNDNGNGGYMYLQSGGYRFSVKDSSNNAQVQVSKNGTDATQDTFYAATRTGNTLRVLVPGMGFDDTANTVGDITKENNVFRIGSAASNIKTNIRAAFVYSRVLNDTEITLIHTEIKAYFAALNVSVV